MKITLIQLDQTNPRIGHRFERYPPFFQTLFHGAGFEFQTAWVLDGEALPDPAELDGVIITGSKFGVYDDPPWIDPLRGFIRDAYAAQTPMLGVCFGHQIMAEALGADVRKAPQGWGLGRQDYALALRPGWARGLPDTVALAASHQDQVLSLPDGAELFLRSEFCPFAGLIYGGGGAISLQPHPEYEPDYAKALIDLRDGEALSPEAAAERRASLDTDLHDKAMGEALARFFRER